MQLELIPQLLGQPIHDPGIISLMQELDVQQTGKDDATIIANGRGVHLQFQSNDRPAFSRSKSTGDVPSKKGDLFLVAATFDRKFFDAHEVLNVHLPFRLLFGYQPRMMQVSRKFKQFVNGKKATFANCWSFVYNTYEVIVALDENEQLNWFRVEPRTELYARQVDITKLFKQQQYRVHTFNIAELNSMKVMNPTLSWILRMNAGDHTFDKKNIKEVNSVLEKYIDQVIAALQAQKVSQITAALKKSILSLNRAAAKNMGMIENKERKELLQFFEDTIRLCGLQLEPGVDFTSDWRTF